MTNDLLRHSTDEVNELGETYFNCLFPTVADGTATAGLDVPDETALLQREKRIAREACRRLAEERMLARLFTARDEDRQIIVRVEDSPLDMLSANVCLDCAWIEWWDAIRPEHPEGCLDGVQTPDLRDWGRAPGPPMGPLRITPDAKDLGAGEWGPYFDALFSRRAIREAGRIAVALDRAAEAERLWTLREVQRKKARNIHVRGRHRGIALEDGDNRYAACLTCNWIMRGGSSIPDEHWREAALERAQQHVDEAAEDGLVFQKWDALADHFGGEDALKEEIQEACDYDYPEVEIDDLGDGPTIVLQAPSTEYSPGETLDFPISEGEFWRRIEDLNQRLTAAVEVIDLPVIEQDDHQEFTSRLVDALAERLSLSRERVLNTIGGGWISCDDLVADRDRGTKKWFSVGDPVLAVIGIGRQETSICEAEWIPAGMFGPARLELGMSADVGTEDLFDTDIDEGAAFLAETITKARKRLRLCKGCRQVHRYVSDYESEDGTIKALCEGCAGRYLNLIIDH